MRSRIFLWTAILASCILLGITLNQRASYNKTRAVILELKHTENSLIHSLLATLQSGKKELPFVKEQLETIASNRNLSKTAIRDLEAVRKALNALQEEDDAFSTDYKKIVYEAAKTLNREIRRQLGDSVIEISFAANLLNESGNIVTYMETVDDNR